MSLNPRVIINGLDVTAAPFGWSFDADMGEPATAVEAVAGLLLDGELVTGSRSSNRVLAFTVYIEWADMDDAAAAEDRLVRAVAKRIGTLEFAAGDATAKPTRFTIMRGSVKFVRDDEAEKQGLRRFDVQIPAMPYVTDPTLNTFTLTTGSATINACTSLTGWTTVSGSASISGGFITAAGTWVGRYTPAVALDAYLRLVLDNVVTTPVTGVSIGGYALATADMRTILVGSNRVLYARVPDQFIGTTAVLEFTTNASGAVLKGLTTVSYPDQDSISTGLVGFQSRGSVRSPVTISLYRSGGALGNVFIWTGPNPGELLQTGRAYAAFGSVTVTEGGAYIGEGGHITLGGLPLAFGAGTTTGSLGQTLPQATLANRLLLPPDTTISTAGNVNTVSVGTQYGYPVDADGAFTYLAGLTSQYVWIVPATPGNDGGVFTGATADGSDAAPYSLGQFDKVSSQHAVYPGRSGALVVASGAGAVTTFSHHPAFWNHVA